MSPCRLAVIATHPIQYTAPVFRALAACDEIDLRVFYTWSQAATSIFDHDFGRKITWDVPLLDGYEHSFVENVATHPGTESFWGLKNPTLVPEIEAWRPDAILVYSWNSESHLGALRHFKGRIPVFFRGDSTLVDKRPWWRAVLRRASLTWIYSHIDVAIAVGSNNRDYFTWCGLPQHRIAFAPHSIDTVRFGANSSNHELLAQRWRSELGIAPDATVILFAGKLQSKKNPDLLLGAFSTLEDGAHLVFVGNGERESILKEKAKTRKNVHFMPFQNQSIMPAVYRLGDVFVLPSRGPEETWGLALNEAMASARPIIASSNVGGTRDLVLTNENGWSFPSGDEKGLRAILRQAVGRGPMGLRQMGNIAQTMSASWSTQESARCIADAILAWMNNPQRRPSLKNRSSDRENAAGFENSPQL
jgi:glycosyltransferase involved in cell wall biosynthesis